MTLLDISPYLFSELRDAVVDGQVRKWTLVSNINLLKPNISGTTLYVLVKYTVLCT